LNVYEDQFRTSGRYDWAAYSDPLPPVDYPTYGLEDTDWFENWWPFHRGVYSPDTDQALGAKGRITDYEDDIAS